MPLIEHIRELRGMVLVSLVAFVVCCVAAFAFSDRIIWLFTRQFETVGSVVEKKLVVTTIIEGFAAQIKISVIAGLILSLPVHVISLTRFVFPGLTARQRRIMAAFIACSFGLILVGAYIAYFRVVPLAIAFLTNPHFVPEGVGYLLSYQANIFYVFSFILWSVAALQAPLVMELLLVFKVLKRRQVWKASRFILVGIFVVSAVITPPDFISQLGVALPLVFFFYLALLIAKIFGFGAD